MHQTTFNTTQLQVGPGGNEAIEPRRERIYEHDFDRITREKVIHTYTLFCAL